MRWEIKRSKLDFCLSRRSLDLAWLSYSGLALIVSPFHMSTTVGTYSTIQANKGTLRINRRYYDKLTTLGERNEQIPRNPQKVIRRLAVKGATVLSLGKLDIKRGDQACKGAAQVHHCEWTADAAICSYNG